MGHGKCGRLGEEVGLCGGRIVLAREVRPAREGLDFDGIPSRVEVTAVGVEVSLDSTGCSSGAHAPLW